MSRFLLFILAAIAMVDNAVARDAMSTSVDAIATNACAMLATKILTGVDIGDMSKGTALCNAHPRRQECFNTQRFIAKYGKAAPELTCGGTSAPPAPPGSHAAHPGAADPAARDDVSTAIDVLANNACSMVATHILTGIVSDFAKDTALCNALRREECLNTKQLIERNGKAVPELTCAGASAVPASPGSDDTADRGAAASTKEERAIAENACDGRDINPHGCSCRQPSGQHCDVQQESE